MHIIALAQMKGGVGKSAAAINLACQAAAQGHKAALIDMDLDQGTARKWGERRGPNPPQVLTAESSALAAVLEKLDRDGFEWVFVDLPGRSAPSVSAGTKAANFLIVPCRPLNIDIEASAAVVEPAVRNKRPYAYLINITPWQMLSRAKAFQASLREAGHPVIETIINQRVQVPDAIDNGQGVNETNPHGKSAEEFAAIFTWLKENVR